MIDLKRKWKWKYSLYLANAYITLFLFATFVQALVSDILVDPEEMLGFSVYLLYNLFTFFRTFFFLCAAWDLGYFLLWLSKKGAKNRKGIPVWFRILFFISLLPYALILFLCVLSFFFGVDVGWGSDEVRYGWQAFSYLFLWCLLVLTTIPVLPACIIVQVVYTIRRIRAKTKSQS